MVLKSGMSFLSSHISSIVYNGFSSQGAADNLSGMESVKVNGTVCNTGDKEAKNVTVTVVFTDTAHDKVVKKQWKRE